MAFSERLRELRNDGQLTKTKLAEELGTTRQLITMYENGDTVPNIALFCKIAEYFDVSADYLLGREDYANLTHDRKNNCIYMPENLDDDEYSLIMDFVSIVYKRRKNQPKC